MAGRLRWPPTRQRRLRRGASASDHSPTRTTIVLHVDIPTRTELESLLDARAPGSVSIYLPTTPVSTEVEASRIELKNLATAAVEQLRRGGLATRHVASVQEALDDLRADGAFWAYQANSLAVFVDATNIRTFRLPNRIGALVEVSDRYHLKPLLRAVTFPQAAFVLALAQGSVRLLEISADLPPFEVKVDGLPDDVASAVGKASISDRSAARRIQGSEGQKVRMVQYARQVDQAIRPTLAGLELPLILAAAQPLDAIFRAVASYPHLAATGISGNPETTSDTDLVTAARAVLDDVHSAALASLRDRFEARAAQGRASSDIVDVARAATYGAVEAVFVDIDEVVPGRVDPETGAVTFGEPDDAVDYGIVDEIARRAFQSGARVLAVRSEDIPGNGPVAAILRYAI